jgi:hypothetical protein
MSPAHHRDTALPPGLAGRLNPVCDRFEAAWLTGTAPRLEDFLTHVDEGDRTALLRELLELDLYYRGRRGDRATPEEYRERLPQHGDLVAAAFPAVDGEEATSRQGRAFVGSAPTASAARHPVAGAPGLPGYEMLGELGRGGMGVVYRARQVALNRVVAVKMILAGSLADPADLVRFRREAEVVARLQHPGVVQVFEIGEHQGMPFLVLEYCGGGSLRRLLDGKPLPPRQAARLAENLAYALDAAHQRQIVHRDLKPLNLLLTETGEVKIADFGLARRLDGASAAGPQSVGVVGTPSYMPPEQARGEPVGPEADVYALGAVLYELLTGRPPFLGHDALAVMAQVLHDEPVPVRRLQPTVPRDLETICLRCLHKQAQRRYSTAAALAEDLRRFQANEPILARPVGQLERVWKWVRRRPAVAALTAAVLLVLLAGVCGTTAALLAAWDEARRAEQAEADARGQATVADGQRLRAEDAERQARKDALRATAKEHDARLAAEAEGLAKQKAEKRLAQVVAALEILKSTFAGLDLRAAEAGGPPLPAQLGANLESAASLLEGEEVGDPLAVAQLQLWLARAQLSLGYPKRAVALLGKARMTLEGQRGPNHPETLSAMDRLASAHQADGQLQHALLLFEETLAKRKALLGADHDDTLASTNNLASAYRDAGQFQKAVPLFAFTLEKIKAKLGPDHRDTLTAMNNLATAYQDAGLQPKALQLFEETLPKRQVVLGADHPDTLRTMNNLAVAYLKAGQFQQALPLFEETLARRKAALSLDHPDTLQSMNNLAEAYRDAGQLKKALPLFEEALAKRRVKSGPDHPQTLVTMNNLASAYWADGRLKDALPLFEEALAKFRDRLGPDHPSTLVVMNSLALAYRADGQHRKAVPLFETLWEKRQVQLGPDHLDTLAGMTNLAEAYRADGQLKKALPLLEAALAKYEVLFGPDHVDTLVLMNNLALAYWHDRQHGKALPLFEQTLAKRKARLGPDHLDTLVTLAMLGGIYFESGRFAEAISVLEEAVERTRARPGGMPGEISWVPVALAAAYDAAGQFIKSEPLHRTILAQALKQFGSGDVRTGVCRAKLGSNLLQQKRYAEAEALLRDSLQVLEAKQPEAWTTFDARSALGGSLLAQKKYAEAEPLLLEGYRGLKAREGQIPKALRARLSEALQRLVELYDVWDRPVDAARWRKELEMLKAK